MGPIDGHNIATLTSVFRNVKRISKPVVVHVVTKKGHGYMAAEGDPTLYHGVGPFSVLDGKIEEKGALTFSDAFSGGIVERAGRDDRVVAVTAAMSKGTGLSMFNERFPDRFFDVGITEQHAVTFAAGLATGGARPVVGIYSTFLQRSIDQLIHDVVLPGLPVVFAVDRAGVVPGDGETHQGLYDVAFSRALAGLTVMAPATADDLRLMLNYAFDQNGPAMIRYPKAACPDLAVGPAPLEPGRGRFLRRTAEDVLLVTMGGLAAQAMKAADVSARRGRPIDIYDLRFVHPIDTEHLLTVLASYHTVLVFEEAAVRGGIGEFIGALLYGSGCRPEYEHFGIPDAFSARGSREELLRECGLDAEGIVRRVLAPAEPVSNLTNA